MEQIKDWPGKILSTSKTATVYPLLLFALMNLTGCLNKPFETYEQFRVYHKTGDPEINLLLNDELKERYTYPSTLHLDLTSLKDHGEYLTDSLTVLLKYRTDGEIILMELSSADRATFQTFGESIYAKDAFHVYGSRNGIIESADVNTFDTLKLNVNGNIALGKDAQHYYYWDQIVTDTAGFSAALKEKYPN